jgi:hypothetical protein
MRSIKYLAALILLFTAAVETTFAGVQEQETGSIRAFQERTYRGKPITFWLKALRDKDKEQIASAFDAIRSLNDDAWIAVPELTGLLTAPFAPIRPATDSREVIASKILDILVRGQAVETLAWIGEPAAPATSGLVQWALTERVVSDRGKSGDDRKLFIELVAIDAEQRIRVAATVASFGAAASPAVAKLLTSFDEPKRRLAVAIIGPDALPIGIELLLSDACEDRELGLLVIKDMGIIIDPAHIDELTSQYGENCTMLSKLQAR